MTDETPLLRVDGLKKYFWENDSIVDRILGDDPVPVRAVDGLDFEVRRGETLGLVGESGCGKSTTGETILRLQEATEGRVTFDGENVFEMDSEALTAFRRESGIVFQDPFSSLDPRMTIGQSVSQPLRVHEVGTQVEREERTRDLLERVGLSADQFDRYPHEFSGGQRQRIGIARALALEPEFLVLDEPTSALDVSVQAQVLNLLADLQEEFDLTYLLISHDLSVVRHLSDRVAVMYLGEIAEIGPVDEIFEAPAHPYTEALLDSVPRASVEESHREHDPISGDVPSPRSPPSGCRFRTRCPAVISPPELTVDQTFYRAVMDVRRRIEDEAITLKPVGEDEDFEVDDEGRPLDVDAFTETLETRLFEDDLPAGDRSVVRDAFEALAVGEWNEAGSILSEQYESVCERQNPELEPGTHSHPVACHLHDETIADTEPSSGVVGNEQSGTTAE